MLLLQILLADRAAPDVSFQHFASSTEGYSGSDIHLLAKEAAMRPLRRLIAGMALAQQQQEQRQQRADQPESKQPEVSRQCSGIVHLLPCQVASCIV